MRSTRTAIIVAMAFLGLAVAVAPGYADPVDEVAQSALAAVKSVATVADKCIGYQYHDVPPLSYRVHGDLPIYFDWIDSESAEVDRTRCSPGVKATMRIRDFAGPGAVATQAVYDSGLCSNENAGGYSVTVHCELDYVPYYSVFDARATSYVLVDATAWNKNRSGFYVQYYCEQFLYEVVASPTGPRFLTSEPTRSPCPAAT